MMRWMRVDREEGRGMRDRITGESLMTDQNMSGVNER